MAWSEFRVTGNEYWRQHWAFHALIVIWIDADLFVLGIEGELAAVERLELVMALKIRPTPYSTVYNVRQSFPVRDLNAFD